MRVIPERSFWLCELKVDFATAQSCKASAGLNSQSFQESESDLQGEAPQIATKQKIELQGQYLSGKKRKL